MLQKNYRKELVELIKCANNAFPKKALRLLLFASSPQRKELFNAIIQNGLLRNRFSKMLYGSSISQLGYQTLQYNPKMSADDAIQYADFLVGLYPQKINTYLSLREQYQCFYLLKDYISARRILSKIDAEVCASLWSCGQHLLLSELEFDLEANKEQLGEFSSKVPKNYATLFILHFYSCLAESNLSYENYQMEVSKLLRPLGKTNLGKYLTHKLSLETTQLEDNISLLLQIDSQYSIIDIYNDLEQFIPLHYQKGILSGEFDFSMSICKDTSGTLARNLKMLNLSTSDNYQFSTTEKALYQIIESYTTGNYEKVLILAEQYLNSKPFSFQVSVIFCKALLQSGTPFPADLRISYVKHVYSIYRMDHDYRESVLALKKEMKQNHGCVLQIKIYNFLSRKHLVGIGHDDSFVSSLLDESLHPNFIRYLSDDVLSRVERILSPECPVAVSLACTLLNKSTVPIVSEQIPPKRLAILEAENNCNKGETDEAIKSIEFLENICDSDDFYMHERIMRIRLKVYARRDDYHSAIQLFVHSFFMNEFLFERLLRGNYIDIPKRIRDDKIESDLHYLIFVYLLNRNDYSKQIRAYSNYLELNHYSSVLDALEVLHQKDNRLYIFFFSSICTINLLKWDVTLCDRGISPENARLRILNALYQISPLKQYTAEMNNISTFEVMRDNLNSINKSRINVDVEKILQQNREQWEEMYRKYLRLSKASKKFVSIDFNEYEGSIQFSKLVESLNIQIKNSAQINQETMVLRSILEQIIEECLFSTQYGLETYLSSRIRHGYCRGQLTSFLNELHLVSLRDKNEPNFYINNYWDSKFSGSNDLQVEVKKYLSEFTLEIEKKIDEICREWLRIKYSGDSIGMFDYSKLIDACIYFCQGLNIEEFPIFYSRVISLFWETTNINLKEIRSRITNELHNFYIDTIERLENRLRKIPLEPSCTDSMKNLLANCTLAKSGVVRAMEQFKDVFFGNNAHYNNFTMQDLSTSCKRVIERLYTDSENALWTICADSELLFDGRHFVSFVDVLCILLNNCLSHSGFRQTSDLKIDLTISEVPNLEKEELIAEATVFQSTDQHIMKLEVKNNLDPQISSADLKQQLDRIFSDIREEKLNRSLVQGEGGSGLHKMCKTIDYNIEVPYYVTYEVKGHSITLSYVFVADSLLHTEE